MIITKNKPFTKTEIARLRERFDTYIKTVIDVKQKICSAGCDRHYEGEKILLKQGSKQTDIWGGGIDVATHIIDCNSLINIRPGTNRSNEIQDSQLRERCENLTRMFFVVLLKEKNE